MAFQVRSIVVGQDKIPKWLDAEAASGRVKFEREDGELKGITCFTPTGTLKARLGDVVVLGRSGLVVMTIEQARERGLVSTAPKKTVDSKEA